MNLRPTIIACDDAPEARDVIRAALEDIPADLHVVGSGEEALRLALRCENLAVAILDVSMPSMGGFEVAELLRRRTRFASTPIIFMTGVAMDQHQVFQGYELGAVDYLFKPVDPHSMHSKVSVFVELDRQRRELEEAHQRKDEFLATLAHELRNPLAPMRTALELMRLRDDDVTRDKCTAVMERQLHRLSRLVDDLLDVARITQGKVGLEMTKVRIDEVVAEAVEDCRPLLAEKGHELEVSQPETPIVVHGDFTRLSQVLANLLDNACKYTASGTGEISIDARGTDDGRVKISVTDNGLGIPGDRVDAVFEQFTQLDRSLETGYKGLGVGLNLVRSLVELHGGTVEASSPGEGKGSTFTVTLPRADQPSAGSRSADEREHEEASVGLRILVVDDNEDAADMLGALLESLGHEVRVVYDGLEAVRLVETFQPRLALLDLGMPTLNGYDAAARIRALPGGADITLAAVTGWAPEQKRSDQGHFDHHLIKPVDLDTLRPILDDIEATETSSGQARV